MQETQKLDEWIDDPGGNTVGAAAGVPFRASQPRILEICCYNSVKDLSVTRCAARPVRPPLLEGVVPF